MNMHCSGVPVWILLLFACLKLLSFYISAFFEQEQFPEQNSRCLYLTVYKHQTIFNTVGGPSLFNALTLNMGLATQTLPAS